MASNISLDSKLVDAVLKLSGARTKTAAVELALKEFIARRWAEENRESITAVNSEIEVKGVWSNGKRVF